MTSLATSLSAISPLVAADTVTLGQMLRTCRPAWSKSERRFIQSFLLPLGLESDQIGNLYKRIGDAPVLWSSHTDTVHKMGGTQRVSLKGGKVRLGHGSRSNCLGADCTAGVWLMREMILANVPGLYVFHRCEERGGIGSNWLARNNKALLEGIQFAIAFDRHGTNEVITEQSGGMCASDAFAWSLAAMLPGSYKPSPYGSFTDTANYVDIIPECSNIGVGYENEHSARETLDVRHLLKLREALLTLDVSKLVCKRRPGDNGYSDFGRAYGYGSFRDSRSVVWGDAWSDDLDGSPVRSSWRDVVDAVNNARTYATAQGRRDPDGFQIKSFRSRKTILELVKRYPDEIADWLESYGIDPDELETAIYERGAILD